MELIEFYGELKKLEDEIQTRGLVPTVDGRVNWCGERLAIQVRAAEPFDANGNWSSEREFDGSPEEVEAVIQEARGWIAALPSEEDRIIELMIQKLNMLAGQFPKGGSDIAQTVWKEIHSMLMAKAEALAKNGLPSPARIQQLHGERHAG